MFTKRLLFVFVDLMHAGTRQKPYWVINAKPTYCRSVVVVVVMQAAAPTD